jgi:glycosyltransferase involved in cell wall biosynthesis
MTAPLRVLCLDIEGGFGGSSRSLFQSLSYMDRGAMAVEVWCRRDGPVRSRYQELGIPCRVMPDMPHISSLPALSRNLYVYWRFLLRWPGSRAFRRELAAAAAGFDVIHFNHEGLFLLMRWLRQRLRTVVMTGHVRTLLPENVFSRWQYRMLARSADRLVFITENERDNVMRMTGDSGSGRVIYNIAAAPAGAIAPHPAIPDDKRLKVGVLSNFALVRGTDRLEDIARVLASRGRTDILFVVAGNMRARGSLPGTLGQVMREGGTFADHIAKQGLGDMFLFLGHVATPESVLLGCDLLLKPSRDNAPWGRDILETLALGRPVVATGHDRRFVEPDKTGFLLHDYSPEAAADVLLRLDADRGLCRRLGDAAAARIAELCDGPDRARDLLQVWREAGAAQRGHAA